MQITVLLRDITQTLEKLNLPYFLSGSLAYNVYAIPRSTRDIDIVIEIQSKNIDEFIGEIEGKYYYHKPTIKKEIVKKGMFNIIHLKTSYKIDFIIGKDSIFEKEKFSRREKIMFAGTQLWVISLNDLIISKLMWIQQLESEMQKNDIRNLLKNDKTDIEYVKRWCEKLKLKTYNLI